jgi:hypothetical protein
VKHAKYIITSTGQSRMTEHRQMFLSQMVDQPCKVRSDTKGMSGASSPKTTAHCPLVWYRIPFLVPHPDSTHNRQATRLASFIQTSYHASAPLGNSTAIYGLYTSTIWELTASALLPLTTYRVTKMPSAPSSNKRYNLDSRQNWRVTPASPLTACSVFYRPNTGFAGSNPTRSMCAWIRFFHVWVVPCM